MLASGFSFPGSPPGELDQVAFQETGRHQLAVGSPSVSQSSWWFQKMQPLLLLLFSGLVRRKCLDFGSETRCNN